MTLKFILIIKIENSQSNQLENVKIKTFFGGPVLTEKMIVLHTNTLKTENAVVITDKISISSEKDIFRKIDKNINMKYKLSFLIIENNVFFGSRSKQMRLIKSR